ncbi:sensor histidine kinase [Vallitalea pronyensis]|uniref:Sensor histidine kinase n=1 Tax=Vallitalea pronyensis TaxID=1348613 RepID=A0A8J8ML08_9FIRM|nr:histidine kinase [Vallitalea pronyensis]QUI23183.1 sensor histidine kinase [Vallitalea pronyensis]
MHVFKNSSRSQHKNITSKGLLRDKIILIVSLSIVVPTFFFLFYIYTFVNDYIYNNYVNDTIEHTMSHLEDSVIHHLRIIENSYRVITSNQYIRENLYNHQVLEPSYYHDQLTKLNIETELNYMMSNDIAHTRNLIDSVFIISDPHHYYYILSSYLPNKPLIESTMTFYKNHMEDASIIRYIPEYNALYYMKSLEDYVTGEHLGKVIIGINMDELSGSFGSLKHDNWHTMIFDANNTYYFNTHKNLIGTAANTTHKKHALLKKATAVKYNSKKYLATSHHIKDLDYNLLMYIPATYFDRNLWKFFPSYVYFIVFTLLLSTIVGIYAINHITIPLGQLTKNIADISDNNFKSKMPSFKYKELNDLSIAYNRMIEQIQYLFNEVYEKQLLIRESELKALHAQINPHFIFNVLESITWEARSTDNETIEKMVTALGQLLRNNLSFTDQQMFTIEQELEYISFYLYLQQVRFSDRLSYTIQIESDDLLAYTLPKFTIQTFVENAVIHGLEKQSKKGIITINLTTSNDELVITVKDNGVGFHVNQLDLNNPQHNSHIGLKNVRQRMTLLYGATYGFTLESYPNKGTTATIKLPIDRRITHD